MRGRSFITVVAIFKASSFTAFSLKCQLCSEYKKLLVKETVESSIVTSCFFNYSKNFHEYYFDYPVNHLKQ